MYTIGLSKVVSCDKSAVTNENRYLPIIAFAAGGKGGRLLARQGAVEPGIENAVRTPKGSERSTRKRMS